MIGPTQITTVGQLLQLLQQFSPNMPVVLNDHKRGLSSAMVLTDKLHKDTKTGHYSYSRDDGKPVRTKHLILYGKDR